MYARNDEVPVDSANVSPTYSVPQNLLNKSAEPPGAFYTKKSPADKTLIFESRFESGNLNYAVKVSDTLYILVLQNDTNCMGHTQWYYFRVSNTRRGDEVQFNIVNMVRDMESKFPG